jgi:hypothetical protein
MRRTFQLACALLCTLTALAFPVLASSSEYHGQITFRAWPVPGATVTVIDGTNSVSTVSDQGGRFTFADLPDGPAKIKIEMQCFRTIEADLTIAPHSPAGQWELTLLPLDQIINLARSKPVPNSPAPVTSPAAAKIPAAADSSNPTAPEIPKPQEDAGQEPSDGLLINGSVNNAATSRFSLDQAFGNKRFTSKSLYSGGLAVLLDNSALDARPYSLSGLEPPKSSYNRITGVFTLGGPIKIPHLLPHGPIFFVAYQWTRDQIAQTESGLVPTAAERTGDLAGLLSALGQPVPIFNPATGTPFAGNMVPVSPQAQALLQLYPLPNLAGNPLYNYQAAVLNSSHRDALQSRLDKTIGRKDELYGSFNFQNTKAGNTSLLGFTDSTDIFGINLNINWAHRFSQHLFLYASYHFSRLSTNTVPYFENRQNVSSAAGISGNDQDPVNWGPPTLNFSSGIAPLTDATSSFDRARTDSFAGSAAIYHRRHELTLGGDFRKQQFNDFFEQNPRGIFTFTGAATEGAATSVTAGGSDLADFLIGVPDASSIAFGNADKYLREPVYDAYANDDWHLLPALTINAGLRWEYGAPVTEIHGRLVNLDVAPGFADVAPVLASDPIGPLTGIHYPSSLVRPDRRGFEPRVGIAWRPIPASTIVVRAGYGVYHDTSVYQTAALALAQQAPLSKSLSVANSAACPLTLANGFQSCSATTNDTFAVDPDFRVGYAQVWQLSLQRDLPAALQLTATYLGIKGTRGVQQFLPNTYPIGAANPCPACPSGFVYQNSGGDSTRQQGQIQLRRRLRGGFTATLLYTLSKSIDDDAQLGGLGHVAASAQSQGATDSSSDEAPTASPAASTAAVAQNWLDLHAERSLSSFDQRHLLNLQVQYTSGEGLGGRTLMTGWPGRLLRGWTFLAAVEAGTGLPETPVYLAAVPGTGSIGTIRPDPTGAPISIDSSGAGPHLNVAAYAAPLAGDWGTAGRNSITGPGQFSLDSSLARTFRPSARFYLDARLDATNLLNHVVFTGWNTTVNSTQFGLPLAASPMRSLETSLRLRF